MDYPPVSNLITATFDSFRSSQKINIPASPEAPQPVAASQELEQGSGLGLNAPTTNSADRVGTVLNVVA